MAVDWTKPIEAVHEDGRIIPAVFSGKIEGDDRMIVAAASEDEDWIDGYHKPDGLSILPSDKWRIRNVQPTQPPIPADIAERAIALVRAMEQQRNSHADYATRFCYDNHVAARSILADLEPVSVDLLAAREILAAYWRRVDNGMAREFMLGDHDHEEQFDDALQAYKRIKADRA